MRAIDIGSVEMGDAVIDGMVDDFDHIRLRLRRAIAPGHAHAPKPLC